MMELTLNDNECWLCGGSENITLHHVVPKHLKPKRNLQIPLCKKCHQRININDINGLYAYAYKLEKQGEVVSSSAKRLMRMVELSINNMEKLKNIKKKAEEKK